MDETPRTDHAMGDGVAVEERDAELVDAPDVLTLGIIFCCDTCGTPTESEPCREHQPNAWKECNQ